jgi:hypothetical protein
LPKGSYVLIIQDEAFAHIWWAMVGNAWTAAQARDK